MAIKQSKKGAVELSLNLIIMLVIGLTVLGLVIGFVVSLINQGRENFEESLNNAQLEERDKVEQEEGVFVVGPKIQSVKAGEAGALHLKMENRGETQLTGVTVGSGSAVSFEINDALGDCGANLLTINAPTIVIEPNDFQVISIPVPTDVNRCETGDSFYMTFTYQPTGGVTKSQTIEVQIS